MTMWEAPLVLELKVLALLLAMAPFPLPEAAPETGNASASSAHVRLPDPPPVPVLERVPGTLSLPAPAGSGAVVSLELVDPGLPVGEGRLIRQLVPALPGETSLPFELPVRSVQFAAGRTYLLRAALIGSGGERLASIEQAAVLPVATPLALTLAPVTIVRPAPPLEDTLWRLVAVGDTPARLPPGERGAYLLLFNGQLTGDSGCNKLMGTYRLDAQQAIGLGRLTTTRRACSPELMQQEGALLSAYSRVTRYRIEGETLELLDGQNVLVRFAVGPASGVPR